MAINFPSLLRPVLGFDSGGDSHRKSGREEKKVVFNSMSLETSSVARFSSLEEKKKVVRKRSMFKTLVFRKFGGREKSKKILIRISFFPTTL